MPGGVWISFTCPPPNSSLIFFANQHATTSPSSCKVLMLSIQNQTSVNIHTPSQKKHTQYSIIFTIPLIPSSIMFYPHVSPHLSLLGSSQMRGRQHRDVLGEFQFGGLQGLVDFLRSPLRCCSFWRNLVPLSIKKQETCGVLMWA